MFIQDERYKFFKTFQLYFSTSHLYNKQDQPWGWAGRAMALGLQLRGPQILYLFIYFSTLKKIINKPILLYISWFDPSIQKYILEPTEIFRILNVSFLQCSILGCTLMGFYRHSNPKKNSKSYCKYMECGWAS